MNDPTGTYAFAYDNMGRLIGTTTNYTFLTSKTFSNSYAYDAASNRTGFTDPESGSTTYAYRQERLYLTGLRPWRSRHRTNRFVRLRLTGSKNCKRVSPKMSEMKP